MNLDLNGYRLHLVFSPTDMRSGYRTLSAIASSCLQLDVAEGKDCVVFVSARQTKGGFLRIVEPWIRPGLYEVVVALATSKNARQMDCYPLIIKRKSKSFIVQYERAFTLRPKPWPSQTRHIAGSQPSVRAQPEQRAPRCE